MEGKKCGSGASLGDKEKEGKDNVVRLLRRR